MESKLEIGDQVLVLQGDGTSGYPGWTEEMDRDVGRIVTITDIIRDEYYQFDSTHHIWRRDWLQKLSGKVKSIYTSPPYQPETSTGLPEGAKDSNPKDAVGTAKVPMSTVSATVLSEVGVAMLEGARKYGRHNYRVIGVRGSVYYDAAMRHLMDWYEGTDIDPDSGMSHITKAITSLIVLRDAMIQDKFIDDRPPVAPKKWQQNLNEKCMEIISKYPQAAQVYTQSEK